MIKAVTFARVLPREIRRIQEACALFALGSKVLCAA